MSLIQLTTPPSSPNPLLSKCFVISNTKELVKAVTNIQITSTYTLKYTYFHTPPKNLLNATFSPAIKCYYLYIPPNSLDLQKPIILVILQDLKHLVLELIGKFLKDNSKVSNSPKLNSLNNTKLKEVIARASLLAFKEVNKI